MKVSIDEALKRMHCPKCKQDAPLMTPLKKADKRMAVYGCRVCGLAFKADGGIFLNDTRELQEVFSGKKVIRRTLTNCLLGERLNPATEAFLTAEMTSYGLQMWYDGFKQGLLLGARQAETTEIAEKHYDGEARNPEGRPDQRTEERGSPVNAKGVSVPGGPVENRFRGTRPDSNTAPGGEGSDHRP